MIFMNFESMLHVDKKYYILLDEIKLISGWKT